MHNVKCNISAHLSNINLLLKLPGSGSVISENGSAITVGVPGMNLKHILPVLNFPFASLPVDKLNGILQGVSTEDAEHWTEDLILISLHTWESGRHYLGF